LAVNAEENNPNIGNECGRPAKINDRQHTLLEKIVLFVAVVAAGSTAYQAYVASDTEKRSLRAYVYVSPGPIKSFGTEMPKAT
jgi:hypothetical protein